VANLIIVDASCLYEVVAATPLGQEIAERMLSVPEVAAPHLIDAEVLGVIRRNAHNGDLDTTAALQATEELRDWPGDRYDHRLLIERVWELRHTVRTWDAFYIALAEALHAPLLTRDARLSRATGPLCKFELYN
jgi:predicted nucleic acid-binding protein